MEALEELAYKILLLDEMELALLGVGSYVLGFILGFIKNGHVNKAISRSPYFVFIALIYFLSSCASLIWLFSEPAVEIGALWVVVFSVFLSLAVIGYVAAIACIYRSRDAYETPNYAWFGLVPLLNLVLLLTASKRMPESQLRFTPVISGGSGVIVGFVIFALSAIPTAYVESVADEYETNSGTDQYMTEWANEVKADSDLPQRFENGITWMDLYHLNTVDALVYKYTGQPNRNDTGKLADQLWLSTDGEVIKSLGFRDFLFFYIDDYSREELGVYSSKHGIWFSSMREYNGFVN